MVQAPAVVAVEPTEYAPGDLLENRYRLERLLGEGAQGSVWLAHNLGLDARVAIKLVHAERASEAPTLRLEKEARAAARLGHPAVVRVFDFGRTVTGDAFIVMEYLEGQSLGEKLFECGRLSAVESLRTLLPIADALVVAHARGIVHRDLKPENIFLSPDGESVQPKLLDFGIAKLNVGHGGRGGAITTAGALVGSPAYVSPEQAACREDVGERSDVWSFCVVLYECLTGNVPFDSEDYPELFRQIGQDAPESILEHGVGDLELWEIVRRGLAKSPTERWPTMQSLGQALASWLRAQGIHEDVTGVLLESKWLARTRSDPVVAPYAPEPSSFVRRVERHPALQATQRAPRRLPLARYAVVGGTALGAVLAMAFGLIEPQSPNPSVFVGAPAPPGSVRVALEHGPQAPLPALGSGLGATPPAPPMLGKNHVASHQPLPASSKARPAGIEDHDHASSPRPEASASLPPSNPPPAAQQGENDDLLNPY